MKTQQFPVSGLRCANCARHVADALNKVTGVTQADVNLATEVATVTFNEAESTLTDLQDAVSHAGYQLIVPAEQQVFTVSGMHCARCAQTIEEQVKQLPGVVDAHVNASTDQLHVVGTADVQNIVTAVSNAGYEASLLSAAKPAYEQVAEQRQKHERQLWHQFLISAVLTVPLLYIAMGSMIGLPIPEVISDVTHPLRFALVQLVLTTPVLLLGHRFFTLGFKNLWYRRPNMDSLIALGTSAAYVYSIYHTIGIALGDPHLAHALYYESAAVILTLVTLGKYLEAVAKGKTTSAIKALLNLAPKTATVLIDGTSVQMPAEAVQEGHIIIVKSGEQFATDGEVIAGQTLVDESLITGESMPIEKQIGDKVVSASINIGNTVQYRATSVGENTTLAKIIRYVENAQSEKAPIARLADRITQYFVPIVLALATLAALAWYVIGGQSVSFSISIFIAVLVIACPCALGLATPTAIMVGTGLGAQQGILIKNGEALEHAQGINIIALDKTGTVTLGKPAVTDVIPLVEAYDTQQLLQIAALLEQSSSHPVAHAILDAAQIGNTATQIATTTHQGMGLSAQIGSDFYAIGNEKLMQHHQVAVTTRAQQLVSELSDQGKTTVLLADQSQLIGVIAVADPIKPTSKSAIAALHEMGIEVVMITGDHPQTANAIAKQVGITQVYPNVLPEEKAAIIASLQKRGHVAMVGDGINDAPALAQADVSIAIGSGTDVAIETADIVLMNSQLTAIVTALKLSQKTLRVIKENLFWAFAYNVIGIPVAMGVLHLFGGPLLNPMIAGLAMSLSSVSVLTNTLRLKTMTIK